MGGAYRSEMFATLQWNLQREEQFEDIDVARRILLKVTVVVKALCYKPEGRGFNSR
jgi:hypothetical protein